MSSSYTREIIGALRNCIARSDRDWSADSCDAWIYAILRGWSPRELIRIVRLHGWSEREQEELTVAHFEIDADGDMKVPFDALFWKIGTSQWDRNFSDNEVDAIIYGIVCGWSENQAESLAQRFRWQREIVNYVKRLNVSFSAVRKGGGAMPDSVIQTLIRNYRERGANRARVRPPVINQTPDEETIVSRLTAPEEIDLFVDDYTKDEYITAIREHRAAIDLLRERYRELLDQCPHEIVQEGSWGGARCAICDQDFGWYCPDSPDHACHYFTESDDLGYYVVLNDGTVYRFPERTDTDKRCETDDSCLFCGHPEERK